MFEGVPPNMSVSTSTPCPASAARRASSMAARMSSTDWSGATDTDPKSGASGTMRRSAWRNSSPRR